MSGLSEMYTTRNASGMSTIHLDGIKPARAVIIPGVVQPFSLPPSNLMMVSIIMLMLMAEDVSWEMMLYLRAFGETALINDLLGLEYVRILEYNLSF